jgi:hypothetical protein
LQQHFKEVSSQEEYICPAEPCGATSTGSASRSAKARSRPSNAFGIRAAISAPRSAAQAAFARPWRPRRAATLYLEHTAQINCGLRIMPIREAIADVLSPGGGFLADQQ